MTPWALIAHGGARTWAVNERDASQVGMAAAASVGVQILSNGGTAIDAVTKVVSVLEDDVTFNAGTGAACNEVGAVQLDASIMDGSTLDIGAVIGLKNATNPVLTARALLRENEIALAGEGAEAFAHAVARSGRVRASLATAPGARCDTVGCVARDAKGNLAVATSTGGLNAARAGRVGDVALPGCGFYADNRCGAVGLSGTGEHIARVLSAGDFLRLLDRMTPEQAAEVVLHNVAAVGGEAGLIAVLPDGRIFWDHNSDDFAVAWADAGRPTVEVQLRKGRRS